MAAKRKGRSGRSAPPGRAKPVKAAPPPADNRRDDVLGGFAVGEIRRLIRLVQKTGIGELELTSGGRTMRISAQGSVHVAPIGSAVVPAGSPGSTPAAGKSGQSPAPAGTAADKYVAITAPMVGTFYRAPAPDADPYVEVGHMVEVGQTVCILEAMKLMNEIEADVRGRVVEILVENAQPVEYGQNLFLVEPV